MAGADDATTLQGGQYTEQIRSTNAANLIPTFRDGFIHPLIQRRNRASPQEKYGKQFGGGIFNDAAEKGFINILLNRLWVKYPSRNDAPARTRPIFRRTAAQTRQEQPCRRSPPCPVALHLLQPGCPVMGGPHLPDEENSGSGASAPVAVPLRGGHRGGRVSLGHRCRAPGPCPPRS